jgi:hypothetical protein
MAIQVEVQLLGKKILSFFRALFFCRKIVFFRKQFRDRFRCSSDKVGTGEMIVMPSNQSSATCL